MSINDDNNSNDIPATRHGIARHVLRIGQGRGEDLACYDRRLDA